MGLIKYFFCVNARGTPIAIRGFLTEPTQAVIEAFYNRISEDVPPPPVFRLDNLNFCYIFQTNLYFVVATDESMSPTVLLGILARIVLVIGDYAGTFSEITMQKNLGLVYEIIDEILCFGCPQATDSSNLQHLVHNTIPYDAGFLRELDVLDLLDLSHFDRPLALGPEDKGKLGNEIYFVINEAIEMVVSANNQPLRAVANGTGFVKSYLQGQPSILVQFDPQMCVATRAMRKLELPYDDIVFSPFVQTHSFDADRQISFVPPQGSSQIFTYRCSRPISPPFLLVPVFESKQAKVVVVRLSVQATYPASQSATEVVIKFQCPVEISNASCELPRSVEDGQSGEFDVKGRQVIWRIKTFQGLQEYSSRFRFIFDNGIPCSAETLLGPISVEFSLPFLLSGMKIRNFLVSTTGSSSNPKRWIREISTAQCYTYTFV
jgi:AP-4 complex subunit mu-1